MGLIVVLGSLTLVSMVVLDGWPRVVRLMMLFDGFDEVSSGCFNGCLTFVLCVFLISKHFLQLF